MVVDSCLVGHYSKVAKSVNGCRQLTTSLVGHYSKVAKSVNGCRQLTTSLVGHYSKVAKSVNDLLYIYSAPSLNRHLLCSR